MNIAKYIDHTKLGPIVTDEDVIKLCKEANEHKFASVCVPSSYVSLAAQHVDDDVKVCAVVGFPHGNSTTATKLMEATNAARDGATEIDMVLNIGYLKSGRDGDAYADVRTIRAMATEYNFILKVIIETGMLTNAEKLRACKIATKARVHYIKTSTGYTKQGATLEDVMLLAENTGPNIKVKASGGIRTYVDAVRMIESGASRIGTSKGVEIMAQMPN